MKMRFLLFLATWLVGQPAVLALGEPVDSSRVELAWALHYDPKTLDPAKVDDEASELLRYLTGGVLVRLNRSTLQLEPELAESWNLSQDGKLLTFHLRAGLRFSDGSPLTSADVGSTLRRVLAPATAAPVAEEFLEPSRVVVETPDPLTVRLRLPTRIGQVIAFLDEIAIEPANKPSEAHVTAGPLFLSEYRRGESLRLQRNPYYWRKDAKGAPLPYATSVRLEILANRETEELRFLKGQYALLDSVPPEAFRALNQKLPGALHDLGPSLNTEQLWFNQAPAAPLPAYEKQWFTNRSFRAAISASIHRADLARIAFDGHATPANGFVSPANTVWYNHSLPMVQENTPAALALLTSAGFQKRGSQLFDHDNHPVTFSLLTNAGNRSRERMAALIQQDLAAVGIKVNIVTLDFPALIERLMHTSDYEAALLGLSNVQPDPSSMTNIWLSSSANHQWNPSQKVPATPWEAEIDKAMRAQAAATDPRLRKTAIDRVQAIVAEQLPFIYLVYPNTLCGASPALEGVRYSVLEPSVLSDVATLRWKGERR